jgi:hypothetical protein
MGELIAQFVYAVCNRDYSSDILLCLGPIPQKRVSVVWRDPLTRSHMVSGYSLRLLPLAPRRGGAS